MLGRHVREKGTPFQAVAPAHTSPTSSTRRFQKQEDDRKQGTIWNASSLPPQALLGRKSEFANGSGPGRTTKQKKETGKEGEDDRLQEVWRDWRVHEAEEAKVEAEVRREGKAGKRWKGTDQLTAQPLPHSEAHITI
jgi:hypothetical protein